MSQQDLYKILGVSRTATAAEIKKQYRKLAREYHPDRNKTPEAEGKFKEISAAFAVLGDPKKKARYDKFGINGLREGFDPNMAQGFGGGFGGFGDLDEILGGMFGGGFGGFGRGGSPFGRSRQRPMPKGADLESNVRISAQQAIEGGEIHVPALGRSLKIPKGLYAGQKIRIAGKGERGRGGNGDLYLKVSIQTPDLFTQSGNNLILGVPVKLSLAMRGGKLDVLLPEGGSKTITLSANTQGGQKLRLREHGLPMKGGKRGDLIVQIQIRLPSLRTPALESALDILEEHYADED